MAKILNILVDDKFIDNIIDVFEYTKGENNHDYIIIKDETKKEFQYIKKVEYIKQIEDRDCINFINKNNYDLIILHSLACLPLFKINEIDKKVKILWKAWGFDIYRYPNEIQPFIQLSLLHKKSKEYWKKHYKKRRYINFKAWIYSRIHRKQIQQAINRIDYFSGCLPIEYELMKKHHFFKAKHLELPYFSLENKYETENYNNFDKLGNNILVGNAAAIANNHLDILNKLSKIKNIDKQIIVPLSYGGESFYKKDVIAYGKKLFGQNFNAIERFMPIEQYYNLLSTCSYAVLGYEQQAALGNACELLWNGAKLFLSSTSINYKHFKEKGYKVFTIENDLTQHHLNTPLTIEEKKYNRDVFLKTDSKEINLKNILRIYKTIEK